MHRALRRPCADCNIFWHPLVLTFDHVDRSQKEYAISTKRAIEPELFDRELAKCEVVCRNCHQIREYLRDIDTMKIGKPKKLRYVYYRALVNYLCGGALLRKDAFNHVPLKEV